MQELIAQDAPKRHKLSVHVVSSVCDGENHVISDESPDGAPVSTEVVTVKTNVSTVNVRCTIYRTHVLLPYLFTIIILNVYLLLLFKINYIDKLNTVLVMLFSVGLN